MSDTVLVAIITACATAVPTTISLLFNLLGEYGIKKWKLNKTSKRNAVKEYLDILGNSSVAASERDISKYQAASLNLLYYYPELDVSLLHNAINGYTEKRIDSKLNAALPLIKELSKLDKGIFHKILSKLHLR